MDWVSIMRIGGIGFPVAAIVLMVRYHLRVARYMREHKVSGAVARRVHETLADLTMAAVVCGMLFNAIPQLADRLQRDCAPSAALVPSVVGATGNLFIGGIIAGILLMRVRQRREAKATV